MDEVISKLAAIDALGEAPEVWMDTPEEFAALNQWEYDVAAIKAVPSVQRKTGEWIIATGMMPPEFHGHHICSECNSFANMEPPFGNREDLSKFCPNCGADMRGKQNEK